MNDRPFSGPDSHLASDATRPWLNLDKSVAEELASLVADGKTVLAIKRYRDLRGVSLSEAKLGIHALTKSMQPVVFCPFCFKPLRTTKARQCLECGADWHAKELTQ